MTELEEKLRDIADEKATKILPNNIKKGVNIFGVEGDIETDTIPISEYENCLKQCDIIEGINYTPSEYFTVTNDVLFSDINIKSTLKVQVKFNIPVATGAAIIGSDNSVGETKQFRLFNYDSTCYFDFGSGDGHNRIVGEPNSLKPNTLYNIEFGNRYVKNINTDEYIAFNQEQPTVEDFDYTPWKLLIVGQLNTKIYYMRIFDDGVLVKSLIPVTKSNGTPALYDLMSNTFYN